MKARITITSDYSDQTEAKLVTTLKTVLDRWMWESLNHGAISLETSESGQVFYLHVQVRDPEHWVEGAPVLMCMLVSMERGAAQADIMIHLGSEENVRAREAKYRAIMQAMALEDKRSFLMQIDHEKE
jgi:hypothetical protein